jgi:ubiquinone biosynthesis protein COQ9
MTETAQNPKDQLLDAALMHVPFDGWSDTTFQAAIADTGVDSTVANAVCPRGSVDLAVAYHKRGDALMIDRMTSEDLTEMKYRDKIAAMVRFRLEVVTDKEVVRRGTTLFALPQHAGDGAKLVWGTCDAIWDALGDTSDDVNWYTKRATLSAVYSSTVLYWLGDISDGHQATWEFLDRRIDKVKAQVRNSPTLSKLMTGPNWLLSHVKAPSRAPKMGLPGSWTSPRR